MTDPQWRRFAEVGGLDQFKRNRRPVDDAKAFIASLPKICSDCGTPFVDADGGCASCCDPVWPDHMGSV